MNTKILPVLVGGIALLATTPGFARVEAAQNESPSFFGIDLFDANQAEADAQLFGKGGGKGKRGGKGHGEKPEEIEDDAKKKDKPGRKGGHHGGKGGHHGGKGDRHDGKGDQPGGKGGKR